MQVGHIVQSGGEDRAQDEPDLLDGRRADALRLEVSHPLADGAGHDLVHPHGAEPRQDMLVELVGVLSRVLTSITWLGSHSSVT
jgi:hypothetical protein